MRLILFFILLALVVPVNLKAQNEFSRTELSLSGNGWKVWMDSLATWKTDSLYLPRTLQILNIPNNTPTCGWINLSKQRGTDTKLPVSLEEIIGNGDPTWRYHGVSWLYREVAIPTDWSGKTVMLHVEKFRQRIEIYVNEKLAGYDIVAETPIDIDISAFLKPGTHNQLAFRLTNPGGQRGWHDSPATSWGEKYKLIPGHDFTGLGNVSITVTANTFISNVFVKNLLPANENRIELQLEIINKEAINKSLQIEAEILPSNSGSPLFIGKWDFEAVKNDTCVFSTKISVPEAKLWEMDSPNLYFCNVKITGSKIIDSTKVRFGFRVSEAKENEKGENNFYLNGNRIRIRSAIDWGYYWQTGFYATDEMARKSVENAKAIGLNCISFHRRIGEPLIMKYADELGLLIYEEPGGMQGVDELQTPSWVSSFSAEKSYYAANTAPEKFKRMVIRDRNHPSLIAWGIVNEQCTYDVTHKLIFDETWKLDNSRFISNQSGGHFGGQSGYIPHMRPYEINPQLNYIDDHTVLAEARFQESDLKSHQTKNDSSIIYFGEVRCYCGPDNFYALSKPENKVGYDYKSWEPLGQKTEQYFKQNNFKNHPYIKSPADISVQAGRGLMYIDGRLGQTIMCSNANDGYAINGWSGADLSLGDAFLAWYSAICDEGRNLKGPAADFNYWVRPLQIAISRQNGKYFNPMDTALFNICLINENKIEKGNYLLQLLIKDGSGNYDTLLFKKTVFVNAGDAYAEMLFENLPVILHNRLKAGYITIEATLLQGSKTIITGTEQVLLKNRKSYGNDLSKMRISVSNWDGALQALAESGIVADSFSSVKEKSQVILAGEFINIDVLEQMLKQVNSGSKLIIKFDSVWATALFNKKILKEKVSQWGGNQKPFWNGNGWGYIEKYVGNQAIPSGNCIGTNSWEVPTDPVAFEPFISNYEQFSYGAFFYRPSSLKTIIGRINYGKGTIILAPAYPIDDNNAFNDMLFFNMIMN